MARPRDLRPRYLKHAATGRGRAVYWDSTGKYQDKLLPGPFNSAESKAAFGKLIQEDQVAPPIKVDNEDGPTLAELLEAYNTHAERYYVKNGKPTSELREHKLVIRSLRLLYGMELVKAIGPLQLKAVRQGWVNAGLSRGEVNRRLAIAKRIFRWAASEALIEGNQLHGLEAVEGLKKGRTPARETEPVGPVDDAVVEATLPYVNRYLAGLVELQRLTGMRPGEACIIRRCDIDTGGAVWLYKPHTHKNEHKGKNRIVAIGPKAQTLLKQFFTTNIDDYLFSPVAAVAEMHAERTRERKTPRFPSHIANNKRRRTKKPKRPPAQCYTSHSYAHAIARACDRAFPPPGELSQRMGESVAAWWGQWVKENGKKKWADGRLTAEQREQVKQWQKEHRWHPNQLRHTYATKIRKQHGLEAAQALLGHSKADVTQIYAERNEALAIAVAGQMG